MQPPDGYRFVSVTVGPWSACGITETDQIAVCWGRAACLMAHARLGLIECLPRWHEGNNLLARGNKFVLNIDIHAGRPIALR